MVGGPRTCLRGHNSISNRPVRLRDAIVRPIGGFASKQGLDSSYIRGYISVRFEWDEAKRLSVLRVRGLDFVDGQALFDGRAVYTFPSPRGTEERWVTVGELNARLVAAVWTKRDDATRIITMRRARDAEARQYRKLYG